MKLVGLSDDMLRNDVILEKTAWMWKENGRWKGTFPHELICPQDEHLHHCQNRVHIKGLIGDHWTFIGRTIWLSKQKWVVDSGKHCSAKWLFGHQKLMHFHPPVCHSKRALAWFDTFFPWDWNTSTKGNHHQRHQIKKRRASCRSNMLNFAEKSKTKKKKEGIRECRSAEAKWHISCGYDQATSVSTTEIPTWELYSMYIWIHTGVYR